MGFNVRYKDHAPKMTPMIPSPKERMPNRPAVRFAGSDARHTHLNSSYHRALPMLKSASLAPFKSRSSRFEFVQPDTFFIATARVPDDGKGSLAIGTHSAQTPSSDTLSVREMDPHHVLKDIFFL